MKNQFTSLLELIVFLLMLINFLILSLFIDFGYESIYDYARVNNDGLPSLLEFINVFIPQQLFILAYALTAALAVWFWTYPHSKMMFTIFVWFNITVFSCVFLGSLINVGEQYTLLNGPRPMSWSVYIGNGFMTALAALVAFYGRKHCSLKGENSEPIDEGA